MTDAVIVSTARTGLAKSWKGGFNMTHGATLGGHVIKHAVERAKIDPAEVEDVIMGCALPEGATGSNIARQAALAAGLPVTVPGQQVGRFCSSGLQAIATAGNSIIAGEGDVYVAGGVESISLVQANINMTLMTDPNLMKIKPEIYWNMMQTAENVAKRYNIPKLRMDEYGVRSQNLAFAAQAGAISGIGASQSAFWYKAVTGFFIKLRQRHGLGVEQWQQPNFAQQQQLEGAQRGLKRLAMFRRDDLHDVGIDIKQSWVWIISRQQMQEQFVQVIARHQRVTRGHNVPTHPFSPLQRAYFCIATKSNVQRLQRQQYRTETGTGALHALGNQGNAPMVAGKNIQNQTGLTPVITMEHIGRFVRDSLGGHAAVSRSFVAKAAHPRFVISPA